MEERRTIMSHIEEQELEMFILNQDRIELKRRTVLLDHLEECDACNALAAMIGEVHQSVRQVSRITSMDVEYILRSIVPAPASLFLEGQTATRSTQATDSKGDRFVRVGMWGSDAGMGSLTLYRNPTSSNFRAEFRTDRFPIPRWGVFSFGDNTQVVMGEDGRADFTLHESEIVESTTARRGVIRFPVGSVRVNASSIPAGQSRTIAERTGAFSVRFRRQAEEVKMEIAALPLGGDFAMITVIDGAGNASLHSLHERACVLQAEGLQGETRVNVYR